MNPLPTSHIIFNVQTARTVDRLFSPMGITNIFRVNEPVHVTFDINYDQHGYVEARWYSNDQCIKTGRGACSGNSESSGQYGHGFFSHSYDIPISGKVKLYWCIISDCSDAQLVATIHFTVIEPMARSATTQG